MVRGAAGGGSWNAEKSAGRQPQELVRRGKTSQAEGWAARLNQGRGGQAWAPGLRPVLREGSGRGDAGSVVTTKFVVILRQKNGELKSRGR